MATPLQLILAHSRRRARNRCSRRRPAFAGLAREIPDSNSILGMFLKDPGRFLHQINQSVRTTIPPFLEDSLDEQDLTRLSFLVDALVSAPGMAQVLTGEILTSKPSSALQAATLALRTSFSANADLKKLSTLQDIAQSLQGDPAKPVRFAGIALARALTNRRGNSHPT